MVKVLKPLYDISEAGNHWFTTYHTHYKDKLGIIKSIYNPYLFYSSNLFGIMRMQTDDTLILAVNDFASTKQDTIRSAKIMTKNREHLTSAYFLKFNGIQIKLDLNGVVWIKKSYIEGIHSVTDHIANSTYFGGLTRKKQSPKEQY